MKNYHRCCFLFHFFSGVSKFSFCSFVIIAVVALCCAKSNRLFIIGNFFFERNFERTKIDFFCVSLNHHKIGCWNESKIITLSGGSYSLFKIARCFFFERANLTKMLSMCFVCVCVSWDSIDCHLHDDAFIFGEH